MKRSHYFLARSVIELSSADPIQTLQHLNKTGCDIFGVTQKDAFTVKFEIKGHVNQEVIRILDRYTESYQIRRKNSLTSRVMELIGRPIFCLGLLIIIFLSIFLPSRILFIQVKGNITIPDYMILSAADDCGIHFGSSRKKVRSEEVKNRLIEQLPELEWVGVNTFGCIAEIAVREGKQGENVVKQSAVGSIVASRDGVIISCTTLYGTQICKPGQAVTKGQLLVSGYTDCGLYIQGSTAKADVLAETKRELTIIAPNVLHERNKIITSKRRFRLTIGKYMINFYKNSGISPPTCDKIYRQYSLTLPGGFVLPVSLTEQRIVNYACAAVDVNPTWVEKSGHDYLKTQMVAGKIIAEETQITRLDDITKYDTRYFCTEMIGQIKFEETLLTHGYDGKNS